MSDINQKVGSLLKKIRINEKKSQNSFISEQVSRSKLSRIESGKATVTVPELISFLDNLTITEEEFFNFLLPNDSKRNKIKEKIVLLGLNRDENKNEILKFISELDQKYNDTGDLYYFYYSFYCKNLVSRVEKKDLEFIYNYLLEKKMYTYFDYAMLSNAIMYLNHTKVKKLVEQMLPQISNLPKTNELQGKINLMFLNLLNRGIMNYNENETFDYLKQALEYNKVSPDYFTKVQLLYLTSLIDFRFKKNTKALKECFIYIDIMKNTGLVDIANEAYSEVELYSKYPDSPIPPSKVSMIHSFYN